MIAANDNKVPVKITDIRTRQRGRKQVTYACLRHATTNELLISATLSYVEAAIMERGFHEVVPRQVV